LSWYVPHPVFRIHINFLGETRDAYKILIEEPEGKRLLGRPRRRWEDNIGMDLK